MKKILSCMVLILFVFIAFVGIGLMPVLAAESYTVRFYTTESNFTTQTVVAGVCLLACFSF